MPAEGEHYSGRISELSSIIASGSAVEEIRLPERLERRDALAPALGDFGERRSLDDLFPNGRRACDHVERQGVVDVLVGRLFPLEALRGLRVDPAEHRDAGEDGPHGRRCIGARLPLGAAFIHDRWRDVQLKFVDSPKEATTEAAGLLDEAVEKLATSLRDQKAKLHQVDSDDTETLRVELRGYRDILNRILGL